MNNNSNNSKGKSSAAEFVAGGAAGVILGAAGTFITSDVYAETGAEEQQTTEEQNIHEGQHVAAEDVHMASGVNDDMSFSEAFSSARAEVGANGVFSWHGHLYSTYTADEWNALGESGQHEYSEALHAAGYTAHPVTVTEHHNEQPAEHPDPVHNEGHPEDANRIDGEPEVVIDGVYSGEQDGQEFIVGVGTVNGHAAMFVDSDIDGNVDQIAVDLNDNQTIDENEVFSGDSIPMTDEQMVHNQSLNEPMPDDGIYSEEDPDYSNEDYINNGQL